MFKVDCPSPLESLQ